MSNRVSVTQILASVAVLGGASLLILTQTASAESSAPRDIVYPGKIALTVDATDVERGIFRMQETISVRSGPLTLFYPSWTAAHPAPSGAVHNLAGIDIRVHGSRSQRVNWVRNPADVYAFSVDVPTNVTALDIEFQYISSTQGTRASLMTPEIVRVQWDKLVLYPAGYYVSRIPVQASLILPARWQVVSALEQDRRDGETVHFRTLSLEHLVDSPAYAGKHVKVVALREGDGRPVRLNALADSPEELRIEPSQLEAHRKLVREAIALFQSEHYDHYDFLLTISEDFGGVGGFEHHRSSENIVSSGYFKDWHSNAAHRYILPHEFVHSWNGKFRRPEDQWSPDLNTPLRDTLLWVYEGLTDYWGQVLTVRSGLWTTAFARAYIASYAANLQERRPGRVWRNLNDTNHQAIITAKGAPSFESWQRGIDYYREGALIWLEVDALIREHTGNKQSLDDLATVFYGTSDGSFAPITYVFADIVKALNTISSYDWSSLLRMRLESNEPEAPLDGLQRAGWRLTFRPEPNEYIKSRTDRDGQKDFSYSIGLTLDRDAQIVDVVWDGAAFKAGLAMGGKVVGVNGRSYTGQRLEEAIKEASGKERKGPIELLVLTQDYYRIVKIEYDRGLRYPHLERIEGKEDLLSDILQPRAKP